MKLSGLQLITGALPAAAFARPTSSIPGLTALVDRHYGIKQASLEKSAVLPLILPALAALSAVFAGKSVYDAGKGIYQGIKYRGTDNQRSQEALKSVPYNLGMAALSAIPGFPMLRPAITGIKALRAGRGLVGALQATRGFQATRAMAPLANGAGKLLRTEAASSLPGWTTNLGNAMSKVPGLQTAGKAIADFAPSGAAQRAADAFYNMSPGLSRGINTFAQGTAKLIPNSAIGSINRFANWGPVRWSGRNPWTSMGVSALGTTALSKTPFAAGAQNTDLYNQTEQELRNYGRTYGRGARMAGMA